LFCACDASPELRERDQSIISGTASPNDSAVVALTLNSADCNPVRGDATCTGVNKAGSTYHVEIAR